MKNEKKEIQIMNFVNDSPRIHQDIEEEIEHYAINKERRVTGQKISHKKATKKSVSKGVLAAAIISASALTYIGTMMQIGKNQIVNRINDKKIENLNIDSIPRENGFLFYQVNSDGSRIAIDVDEYLESISKKGQEEGFSADEMSIYLHNKYGVSHNVDGTTIIGRMTEQLKAASEYLIGITPEEGRSK